MIEDALWKISGIIIALVLLFIIPTIHLYLSQDEMVYNRVQQEIDSFSQEIREVGYLSKNRLESFQDTLSKTGLSYDIEFRYMRKKSHDGKAYYETFYMDEIQESLEMDDVYSMHVGDMFFVQVISTSKTKSQALRQALGMHSGNAGEINVVSGGVIRYGDG